jgi:hypothetical protein
MGVSGVKQKLAVIGLKADAQVIPSIVSALEETKAGAERKVLLGLLFR